MGPGPLRVVVDTNVLVSALLKEGSVPERALHALLERAVVLLDARLAGEYFRVLARPKFAAIGSSRRDALLERLRAQGEPLGEVPAYAGALDDPDDRAFVEVALAGKADAIVTGNGRHFPQDLGFEVLPPAAVLARLERGG
ncbi:MAG: putative toxin-antitoxin system toxin component, PIN family [Deltaproteobacteria bacterium]|nr:putative toxin-antitoxin system toxin component, PIN family [Deltaproteobacteria bacterium]